jgi:hypothetical protein
VGDVLRSMATQPLWQGSPVGTLALGVWAGLWPPWIIALAVVHVAGVVAMRVFVPIADAHAETQAALIRRRAALPAAEPAQGGQDTAG